MNILRKVKRANRFRKLNIPIMRKMMMIQSHNEVVHPVKLERRIYEKWQQKKTNKIQPARFNCHEKQNENEWKKNQHSAH